MKVTIKRFGKKLNKKNELGLPDAAKKTSASIDMSVDDTFDDVRNKISDELSIQQKFIKILWPGNTTWKYSHKISKFPLIRVDQDLVYKILYSEIDKYNNQKIESAMGELNIADGSLSDRLSLLGEKSALNRADYDIIKDLFSESKGKSKEKSKRKSKRNSKRKSKKNSEKKSKRNSKRNSKRKSKKKSKRKRR